MQKVRDIAAVQDELERSSGSVTALAVCQATRVPMVQVLDILLWMARQGRVVTITDPATGGTTFQRRSRYDHVPQ